MEVQYILPENIEYIKIGVQQICVLQINIEGYVNSYIFVGLKIADNTLVYPIPKH